MASFDRTVSHSDTPSALKFGRLSEESHTRAPSNDPKSMKKLEYPAQTNTKPPADMTPKAESAGLPVSVSRLDITNQRLLEVLELADSHRCSTEHLQILLERNHERLLHPLASYGAPNAQSKKTLQSGKVRWRTKVFSVDDLEKEFVLKLSKLLELDEVQCFGLFHSFLLTEAKHRRTLAYDDQTLRDVFAFYCTERRCLIQCLGSLLRNADDEASPYHEVSRQQVERLLADGLEKNILSAYISRCEAKVPSHFAAEYGRSYAEVWATECIEEQAALLEVIFLIYYSHPITAEGILNLAKRFQDQLFGAKQVNYTLLTDEGRTVVSRIGSLCVLTLIEVLGLEALLVPLESSSPSDDAIHQLSQANPILSGNNLLKLDAVFRQWLLHPLPHHGPVLLAWSAFLCCVTQLNGADTAPSPPAAGADGRDDLGFTAYAQRAFELQAVQYIHTLLTSSHPAGFFSPEDPNLTGYKSVLKGLFSALLTAFDVSRLPYLDILTAAFAEVFRDQPALCRQFWQVDMAVAARRSLLDLLKSDSPYALAPLLTLLTALASGDAECAATAFAYLKNVDTLCVSIPAAYMATHVEELSTSTHGQPLYRVVQPIPLGTANITVPIGTIGRVVSTMRPPSAVSTATPAGAGAADVNVVQWQLRHSAWLWVLSTLDTFLRRAMSAAHISSELIASSTAALELIDQLIANNVDMATELQTHLDELFVYLHGPVADRRGLSDVDMGDIGSAGNQLLSQTASLLPRVFLIVQYAAFFSSPPLPLLTACFHAIGCFSRLQPAAVWRQLCGLGFLAELRPGFAAPAGVGSGRGAVGDVGAVRHLMHTVECAIGRYPITLAFLDILCILLRYAQRWDAGQVSTPAISPTAFLPCLQYVMSEIYSSYDGWRFTRIGERWQIGIKALDLFAEALKDVSTSPLRETVLSALLFDATFYSVLLGTVAISNDALERLLYRRKIKEGRMVEQLVVKAFRVLERVLNARTELFQNTAGQVSTIATATGIDHALVSRVVGQQGTHLIGVIASYVAFPYPSKLPLRAVRVLTSLCNVTVASQPRPPSLVGYLGDQASRLREELSRHLTKDDITRTTGLELRGSDIKLAVLRFLSTALRTQPGLAEFLINVRTASGPAAPPTLPSDSLLHAVVGLLGDKVRANRPDVYVEVLGVLHALWRAAPEHNTTLRAVRLVPDFWPNVAAPVASRLAGTASAAAAAADEPGQLLRTTQVCYEMAARAMAFIVLSLELFYMQEDGELDPPLNDQIRKWNVRDTHVRWLEECAGPGTLHSAERELCDSLEAAARQLGVDLGTLARGTVRAVAGIAGDDDPLVPFAELSYGPHSYLYDIALAEKKLDTAAVPTVADFVRRLRRANVALSLVDAQLRLLHAWRTFVQTAILRQPTRSILIAVATPPAGDGLSAVMAVIKRAAALLGAETGGGRAVVLWREELCTALALLLKYMSPPRSDAAALFGLQEELLNALGTALRAVMPSPGGDMPSAGLMTSLLSCMLLTMRAKVSTASQPTTVWPTSLASLAVAMLPCFAACLQTSLAGQFRSSESGHRLSTPSTPDPLPLLCVSLIEEVCVRVPDAGLVLPYLRGKHDVVLSVVVRLLGNALHKLQHIAVAEGCLHLLLDMAASPPLAEAIVAENVVTMLCNCRFTAAVLGELGNATDVVSTLSTTTDPHNGVPPYVRPSGDRNGWHRAWCLVLALLTRLLATLSRSDAFVVQVFEFVGIFEKRLLAALHPLQRDPIALELAATNAPVSTPGDAAGRIPTRPAAVPPGPTLTLGSLEETERTTLFLCELGRHGKRWRRTLPNAQAQLVAYARCLLQQYVVLLLRQMLRNRCAIPVAKEERTTATAAAPPTPVREPAGGADVALELRKPTAMSVPVAPFFRRIDRALFRILRNLLAFLRQLTNPTWLLPDADDPASRDSGWDTPLFTPQIEIPPTVFDPPSLGVLLYCQSLSTVEYRKSLEPQAGSGAAAEPGAVEQRHTLLFIIETSTYITLCHLALYMRNPDEIFRRRVRNEIISELESNLARLSRELKGRTRDTRRASIPGSPGGAIAPAGSQEEQWLKSKAEFVEWAEDVLRAILREREY